MSNNRNIETGKRLKEALKRAGMTQKKLADMVHYSPVAINNICAGRSALTMENAHKFADILKCDYQYFTLESEYITRIEEMNAHFDRLTDELESEHKIKNAIKHMLHDSDYGFKSVSELTEKESAWITYTRPDNGGRRFASENAFNTLIEDIAWYISVSAERFIAIHEKSIENFPARHMNNYIPEEPQQPWLTENDIEISSDDDFT